MFFTKYKIAEMLQKNTKHRNTFFDLEDQTALDISQLKNNMAKLQDTLEVMVSN